MKEHSIPPIPPMCLEGTSFDRFKIFKELKALWYQSEEQAGRKPSNKSLADFLALQYSTVVPQRTSQWATGSDRGSAPPDHILMYLCHVLGLVIIQAPEGTSLHKRPQ